MKQRTWSIVLFSLITIGFCSFVMKGNDVGKYICDYGGSVGTIDGTKFVKSGDFYFNCQVALLVRRRPIPFPTEDAKKMRSEDISIFKSVDDELSPFLKEFLGEKKWFEGFEYRFTSITEEENPSISSEYFGKVVGWGNRKIFVTAVYKHKFLGKPLISISLAYYDPDRHLTRQQLIEKTKRSCPIPQE